MRLLPPGWGGGPCSAGLQVRQGRPRLPVASGRRCRFAVTRFPSAWGRSAPLCPGLSFWKPCPGRERHPGAVRSVPQPSFRVGAGEDGTGAWLSAEAGAGTRSSRGARAEGRQAGGAQVARPVPSTGAGGGCGEPAGTRSPPPLPRPACPGSPHCGHDCGERLGLSGTHSPPSPARGAARLGPRLSRASRPPRRHRERGPRTVQSSLSPGPAATGASVSPHR